MAIVQRTHRFTEADVQPVMDALGAALDGFPKPVVEYALARAYFLIADGAAPWARSAAGPWRLLLATRRATDALIRVLQETDAVPDADVERVARAENERVS